MYAMTIREILFVQCIAKCNAFTDVNTIFKSYKYQNI